MFGLGLRVARQGQFAAIGGGQMHVNHLPLVMDSHQVEGAQRCALKCSTRLPWVKRVAGWG